MKVLSRKTWHEVIDDEEAYVLADLGVWYLIRECLLGDDSLEHSGFEHLEFDDYCHWIIDREAIPDEFSYNQIKKILDEYLHRRWEEYNGQN